MVTLILDTSYDVLYRIAVVRPSRACSRSRMQWCRTLWHVYGASLFHGLHWLLICFWVQFKMPIITSKTLHGMGLGYLWDHFCLIISTHLTRFNKWGIFQVSSILKKISSYRTLEVCLFCRSAFPLEHHSPGDQFGPKPVGML